MILTLDRQAGTIGGGGIVVRVDPTGSVLPPWCRAALDGGYDLVGMPLELWDTGADARSVPMLCLTATDAAKILAPDVKPKRGKGGE